MLYYDFQIEDDDKSFLITNGQTLDIHNYPSFGIHNYNQRLVKPDLLFYYQLKKDKDIYKKATNNIQILIPYNRTDHKARFKLFTTSSLLSITLNPKILNWLDIVIDNRKLIKSNTTLIVPKYIALNCYLEIKDMTRATELVEIIFSYPIFFKKFTTLWSLI